MEVVEITLWVWFATKVLGVFSCVVFFVPIVFHAHRIYKSPSSKNIKDCFGSCVIELFFVLFTIWAFHYKV